VLLTLSIINAASSDSTQHTRIYNVHMSRFCRTLYCVFEI